MSLDLGLTYENIFPPGQPLYCNNCSIIPFVKQSMLMGFHTSSCWHLVGHYYYVSFKKNAQTLVPLPPAIVAYGDRGVTFVLII